MKKILFRFTILISIIIALDSCKYPLAVSTLRNQNVYKTKSPIVVERVYDRLNSEATESDKTVYMLPSNIKYSVVDDVENIIYVLPIVRCYKSDDLVNPLTTLDNNGKSTSTINIVVAKSGTGGVDPTEYYFKIKTKPSTNQKYLVSQSIIGMPITLPVKIRGTAKSPVVKMDVSLGYCFGYKLKIGDNPYKKTYINFIPYALALNKETYKANKDDKGEETVSLTYFAFGAMYEYQSFNIGAFIGWDMMFQPQDKWIYQKKDWLSIGIGYKLGKKE